MVNTKVPLGALGLFFISGALVLLFFVILSSVRDATPLNNTYFLQADTAGITGAKETTRWTYFYMCDGANTNCDGPWPAPPFGYAWDRDAANVPDGLLGGHGRGTTSRYYFFMWRFGWVFYIMALFFIVLAWFASFLACCGRLGSAIAGLVASTGLFCYTIAVVLMTVTFVKARDAFHAAGREAALGRYAFGFSWGAWAALFIATVLFCLGLRGDSSGGVSSRRRWRRSKSVRSRRSYDVGGSRRVKDEYS